MTAAVEIRNGVGCFFSSRVEAWHRLGVVVPDVLTAKEALVTAQLDWTVDLRPIFSQKPDGTYVPISDRFAVTRDVDDKVLGTVGKVYTPFQNGEAFDFMDTLVDTGEAKYETAGSLRGGRVVFLTMKVPQEILIGDEDLHELYILLSTSHDGSRGIRADVTPIRVVCWNTLNMAWGATKTSWQIRHTNSVKGKVAEARETLKLTFKYAEEFKANAEILLASQVEDDLMRKLLEDVLPERPKRAEAIQSILAHRSLTPTLADDVRPTAWGALNAFGEYGEHVVTSRSQEGRFLSQTFGYGAGLRSDFGKRLLLNAQ